MPDLLAGTTMLALDTPAAVSAVASASYDTTSTAYTTATSGGAYAEVAVVFVAPTSGRVRCDLAARLTNNGTGGTLVTAEVRTGSTVGAGTVVDAATDASGTSNYGNTLSRTGICRFLSGLAPGSTYNARLVHRVTAGTGSIAMRELSVQPLP
ncbi:hypothetical protein [Streptomyces halstedii]|uniref:hypothetical protein n=1 Tax=Streptomyces halstedii TaxID=1944 RepID=UPI0033BEC6F1